MLFETKGLRLLDANAQPSEDGPTDEQKEHEEQPRQDGQWACTKFRLDAVSPCERYAVYDVSLLTGRTHQIRAHFAGANFPLANDFCELA